MGRYILKRIAYSVLILLGVLMLTFVLFRMAAGDPTATLLGKNPTPDEVESLRDMLGADKPLFWGRWRKTETYSGVSFTGSRTGFPGVSFTGGYTGEADGVRLEPGATAVFRRNFAPEGRLRAEIRAAGRFRLGGTEYGAADGGAAMTGTAVELTDTPAELVLTACGPAGAKVESVMFYRPTRHLFDSQALASLREIAHTTDEFPYVSFFDFGKTLQTRESIRGKLWRGMWPSLFLMVPVFFGELVAGLALAMLSCVWHGRRGDRLIMLLSVAGMSISYLALIIFGQWIFAYYLNWFPVWGWGGVRYLFLPVIIGIVSGAGSGARFYRTVLLNETGREYLRTARAKGLPPWKVWCKHLLRNALVPIITRASTVLPFLFTGSLLLESFFGIPGLGYEGINALNDSDLQMLKALVILGAFLFVAVNLLTDIAYAWVDPRMRPGARHS